MNCVSTRPRALKRARTGYTLVEILVALAIASAFLGGLYSAVIQILKQQNAAEARTEAVRNGRAASSMIGEELTNIIPTGVNAFLQAVPDKSLGYGDRIDNDGDGKVDEETVNGKDDDGDAPFIGNASLAHFGKYQERPARGMAIEPGVSGVDEDCVFGRDKLTFTAQMKAPTPGIKAVSYYIGQYDGLSNVLLRDVAVVNIEGLPGTVERTTPLAFGVLGFDVLCWDSNGAPDKQAWLTEWNSVQHYAPELKLPASIYLRLTLAADPAIKAGDWHGDRPIQTLVMENTVNIESVIKNKKFQRPTL